MMRYHNPVEIRDGEDVLANLADTLLETVPQARRVLLLTRGRDFCQSEAYARLQKALQAYEIREISFTASNPDVSELLPLLQALEKVPIDLIVAVGGGSVLDVGKCIATLHGRAFASAAELAGYILQGSYAEPGIPWVALPTTAGTGSEVTPWATVWDRAGRRKLSMNNPENFARLALLDPLLTVSQPRGLTVSSALDAVCHATEAYWAKNTNPVSRIFALQAIRQIAVTLPVLLAEKEAPELRLALARASLYAGLAFSNTRTTICHSLSYPLTAGYHIPHGVAAVLSLASFLRINQPAIAAFPALLQAFQQPDTAGVQQWLTAMLQQGSFGCRLRDFGVARSDFADIIQHAFTKGRADNNPVLVTEKQLREVLEEIY